MWLNDLLYYNWLEAGCTVPQNAAAHPHRYTTDLSCTKFVAATARHEDGRKVEDRAILADNRHKEAFPHWPVGKSLESAWRPRRQSAIDIQL